MTKVIRGKIKRKEVKEVREEIIEGGRKERRISIIVAAENKGFLVVLIFFKSLTLIGSLQKMHMIREE